VVIARRISALYIGEVQDTGAHFFKSQLQAAINPGHLISDSLPQALVQRFTKVTTMLGGTCCSLVYTRDIVGMCACLRKRGEDTEPPSSGSKTMLWDGLLSCQE
jgi:hypothetical protein